MSTKKSPAFSLTSRLRPHGLRSGWTLSSDSQSCSVPIRPSRSCRRCIPNIGLAVQLTALSCVFTVFAVISVSQLRVDVSSDHVPLRRYLYIVDYWERMVNIHYALRRITALGQELNITVVEPFMHSSMVSLSYSAPEHFTRRSLTPVTYSDYFDTTPLRGLGVYVSFSWYQHHVAGLVSQAPPDRNNLPSQAWNLLSSRLHGNVEVGTVVTTAAVFIDWDRRNRNAPTVRRCSPFDLSPRVSASPYGFKVAPGLYALSLICLNAEKVSATSDIHGFFNTLYSTAEGASAATKPARTSLKQTVCSSCTSVVFLNYRKHLFSAAFSRPIHQNLTLQIPPLAPSLAGQEIAKRIHREAMFDRPYVALQFRTGKMFTEMQIRGTIPRAGATNSLDSAYDPFAKWLRNCTKGVMDTAIAEAEKLPNGRNGTMFFLASDMLNDGWRGGEVAPRVVKSLMQSVVHDMRTQVDGKLVTFSPEKFGVHQDQMGASGTVDASMVYFADAFVYGLPSNFGNLMNSQRQAWRKAHSIPITCDPF